MIKGVAASPGIEIGKAYVMKPEQINISTEVIAQDDLDGQINRLDEAVASSKLQLMQIKAKAEKELGTDKAEIFGAHLMVLEDPVFQAPLN
ncbi:MAG: phosphoenolpyruvate--protein phosphotransferase, partial [Thermoanaerobacteraceae bacterium]|nr:phosphoenolpyruvate--protein phosphotransferase [Thermoanaerobacteraceae bacterium]